MRKKVRKSLAFLLALALVVSVMSGLGLSVSADDAQNESVAAATEGEPAEEKPKVEESTPAEGGKEEKDADPAAEAVQEETKDEKQTTKGEGSGEKAAENKAAETPKAGENVQTATIGTGDKTVTVKTTAAAGVLPEGAKLVVNKLADQDQAYQDAESTLRDSQVTYDDFLALDVGFEVNGKEVEPEAGSVQVQFELGAGLLPETADTSTLAVQHLTDGKAETVADAGAVTAGDVTVNGAVIKADFEVKSFSSFTITWKSSDEYGNTTTYFKATVYYVDEKGNQIDTGKEANVSATGNQALDIKKEYGHDISGYTYSTARYGSVSGEEIVQIETIVTTTGNKRPTTTRTVKLVMLDGTTKELKSGNTATKIYLVYTTNTEGGHTGPSQTLAHEKYVTDNGDHTYDLNLTVSGKKGSKVNKAKVDVLFILDRSGSMGFGMNNSNENASAPNRRIDKVADAVNTLTTNLKDNENIDARYSVVSFAKTASTDQNWTSSASAAYAAVANATPNEGTNYQAGIYEAKEQLASSRKDAQTIVIFLTDGAPTYQGQTTASGEGSFTEQRYIDAAKNELSEMTADGFYCVGVMLDSTITVYTANGTDFLGYTKWESEEKTGKAILQEIIAGGTNIEDKPAPMMASDPKALNAAFDKIKAKITDLLCNNVMVTDVLSENVDIVTTSETDTTPKKPVVTIKKNDDGSIVQGPATSVKDDDYEIKAEYDATAKKITLKFDPDYTLNPDYTYIVTATIEATEKAYENVRANNGVYPNIGDAGTGDTSAGQGGVYSNENDEAETKAKVSYEYNDSEKTEYYNKPVIQLEPAHLTINKTITGLTEEKINSELNDKLTFNITYTYPTGEQKTVTETKKLSDFTKTADGTYTYTYTSGDIWSMGATYEVTETNYDTVTDYDCTAKPTNASGSIPKYGTATASFTNAYTLSTQDLTITKEILVDGNKYKGDEFNDAKYTFTVSGDKIEDKTVTVNGAGSATINGLPVGSYRITETKREKEPEKYKFVEDDSPKTIALSKENHAVTITNKYETNKYNVYVRKELDGNMYDSSDRFDFTVTGKDGTLRLGKGETSSAYEVTYGDSFTVKETNDKGYTSTTAKAYKATVNNDGTVSKGEEVNGIYTDNTKSYTLSNITKDIIIVYTNTKTINPPNGIITTIAPYAIMVVLAAGAGVYFVYSRRRRNR